jgi:hypothetical protein
MIDRFGVKGKWWTFQEAETLTLAKTGSTRNPDGLANA